jgi:serine-type D-Ala-D-Ala carboxypeptidase/endopeptidase (penicillin-binding protein 4)
MAQLPQTKQMAAAAPWNYTPHLMIQLQSHSIALILCFWAQTVLATELPDPSPPLPADITQALRRYNIPAQSVSIVIRDAVTAETVLELNPQVSRRPASTLKVLTTFAALDTLGPNYHWHTRAYRTGPIAQGHLQGDLIIQGGGDPFMSAERWWSFARALHNEGILYVDGDVVIDRSVYAIQKARPDAFDGQGSRSYNVLPDALLVNFQALELHLLPEASDVRVVPDPEPTTLTLDNGLQVTPGPCRASMHPISIKEDTERSQHLILRGAIGSHCDATTLKRTALDAPDYAYGTLMEHLQRWGGGITGHLKLGTTPNTAVLIQDFDSLSLGEVLPIVNKYSSNVMARMLLLTQGLVRNGSPATEASSEQALREWLLAHNLSSPELVIDNGSGLSRLARISADSLARVLQVAHQSRYYPEFAASLPLAGQEGTLKHRFTDLTDQARIRLKTGHLDDVASVAGWVTNAANRPLTVVVLVNHPNAHQSDGDAVIDTVVRWALTH